MKSRLVEWVMVAVVAWLAMYALADGPSVIQEPFIILHREQVEASEPPVEVRWRDRVVYKYLQPDQVALAPGGATDAVASFCRPVTVTATDTVYVDPQVLVRSGVTRDGWWLQRGRVDLVALRNDGDLLRYSYPTRPGWDFIASGDSLLVRYPRLALPRQVAEVTIPPLAVFAVCHFFGC